MPLDSAAGIEALLACLLEAVDEGGRDLGTLSDRIAARCHDVHRLCDGEKEMRGGLLALLGRARLRQRELALWAWKRGDFMLAERAALRYLGFEPPTRGSGDIEKPLPADARYRRMRRELLAARVRLLTGGRSTKPPPCCEVTMRLAACDPSGFAAIGLPLDASPEGGASDTGDPWLLSPLDDTRGFVPCSYDCPAAQAARRATLGGRDLGSLRAALSLRLLQLAPGIDILLTGSRGRRSGSLRPEGIYLLLAGDVPPSLVWLVETLVVRRLLAGAELRFDGASLAARQGLVFVKMLHRGEARWLDWAGGPSTTGARMRGLEP